MEKPECCNSVVKTVVYGIVRKVEETLHAERFTVGTRLTTVQLRQIIPDDFGIEVRNECGLVLLDIIEGVVGASELEGLRSCPTGGSVVSLGDFTSRADKEPSMAKCICSAIPLEDSNVISRGSSQVGLVEGVSGTTHTIDDGARYQEKNDADDIIAMAQTKTDQNFVQTSPETVHSTMVVDIDDEDIEIDTRNVEESSHEINDEEVDEVYQTLWLSRKKELEIRAEQSARTTFLSWQRDRKSLEDIIDGSLKEYIDVYEKAHALRLQFEAEKQQLMSTVNALLSARSSASAVSSYLPSSKLYVMYDASAPTLLLFY